MAITDNMVRIPSRNPSQVRISGMYAPFVASPTTLKTNAIRSMAIHQDGSQDQKVKGLPIMFRNQRFNN